MDPIRKPNTPPASIEDYLKPVGVGLIGAILSSAIAWRFGGSEHGRWAIHGLVATLIFFAYVGGWYWFR